MSIRVTLTKEEIAMAASVGLRRRIESLDWEDRNFKDQGDRDMWAQDIEGACAEVALAKHINRYWHGVNTRAQYDVGKIQVRSILQPHHSLILRDRDADDHAFVLVYARAPVYELLGWMRARYGKIGCYLTSNGRADKPYWQIPQTHLTDMTVAA